MCICVYVYMCICVCIYIYICIHMIPSGPLDLILRSVAFGFKMPNL